MAAALAASVLAVALPAASAERKYRLLRFDEDWSWLVGVREETEPAPETEDPIDAVKYVGLGSDWHLTFSGSARIRVEDDENRFLAGPPIESDTVVRTRAALGLEIGHAKDFRWYAETRAADTFEAERPISMFFDDDPDLLNLFVEGTLASTTDHGVSIRAGRQEMLFGAQRLISPLDWWGTWRTFDGLRVIARTARTSTSLFAVRPVDHRPHDVDSSIQEQELWGAYTTFTIRPGHELEGYGLVLTDSRNLYKAKSAAKGDLERDTLGVRYDYKGQAGWLAETEWAAQRGNFGEDDISAWFGSVTFGHRWRQAPWKPKLTAGLDAASGDSDPAAGDNGTFSAPFPDGHAYFGSMDLVGRSNVEAARIEVETTPAEGLKLRAALQRFWLFDDTDALYDAGGKSLRRDPTGASGGDVGMELDVFVSYTFATHHWVGAEICRWWSGDFIRDTGVGDDAWFAWIGYEFKF